MKQIVNNWMPSLLFVKREEYRALMDEKLCLQTSTYIGCKYTKYVRILYSLWCDFFLGMHELTYNFRTRYF